MPARSESGLACWASVSIPPTKNPCLSSQQLLKGKKKPYFQKSHIFFFNFVSVFHLHYSSPFSDFRLTFTTRSPRITSATSPLLSPCSRTARDPFSFSFPFFPPHPSSYTTTPRRLLSKVNSPHLQCRDNVLFPLRRRGTVLAPQTEVRNACNASLDTWAPISAANRFDHIATDARMKSLTEDTRHFSMLR